LEKTPKQAVPVGAARPRPPAWLRENEIMIAAGESFTQFSSPSSQH
jgi:hypothetical protein